MFRRWLICGCAVMFALALIPQLLADNKKNNAAEEKREKEREQAAEREVKAARSQVDAAQKTLAAALNAAKQAENARDNAAKRIKETRDRLAEKHQQKSGMSDARARQAKAKADLEQVAGPILAALKASSDYQRAVDAASSAKDQLAGVVDISGDARTQKLKEDFLRPGKMERAAIEDNPTARAAKEKVTSADEAVAAAKKRLDELVEADSELRDVQRDFTEAAKRFDDAKRKAAAEQSDLANANRKLQQEIAQLHQIQHANRVDDMRDKQAAMKKNNNNKKKKK